MARAPREGRWRRSVAAPLSRVYGRPAIAGLDSAAGRASQGSANAFPRVIAVLRHRIAGGRRRIADAVPTGFSDARFVVQPAYSLGPHSVSPLRRLAGGCAPSDPRTGNGVP